MQEGIGMLDDGGEGVFLHFCKVLKVQKIHFCQMEPKDTG